MIDKELSIALYNMQAMVTGLFKPRFYNEYVPAIVRGGEGDTLLCIEVGNLLGLSTLTIAQPEGHYIPFPDNKSLIGMMDNPIWFNDWYKENVPKTDEEAFCNNQSK